jgi:hypothetical protein
LPRLLNLVLGVTLAVVAVYNLIYLWLDFKLLSYFAAGVDAGIQRWSGNEDRSKIR